MKDTARTGVPEGAKPECPDCDGRGFHLRWERDEATGGTERIKSDCRRCSGYGVLLRKEAGRKA